MSQGPPWPSPSVTRNAPSSASRCACTCRSTIHASLTLWRGSLENLRRGASRYDAYTMTRGRLFAVGRLRRGARPTASLETQRDMILLSDTNVNVGRNGTAMEDVSGIDAQALQELH